MGVGYIEIGKGVLQSAPLVPRADAKSGAQFRQALSILKKFSP